MILDEDGLEHSELSGEFSESGTTVGSTYSVQPAPRSTGRWR